MLYNVKIIHDDKELSNCPLFFIDKYNWGGEYRPKAFGRLAYLDGYGFLLELTCEESNPYRTYTCFQDPVYKDSAMEAFFDFDPEGGKGKYVNFEMNSNGAMLNHFGSLRPDRADISRFTAHRAECHAVINDDSWSITLAIPNEYISELFGKGGFECGDIIRCNFYKICESSNAPCPEHYGSYAEIKTEKPDFHRPEFFAEAVLC